MRFLTMVRSAENAGPPPKELMEAIAKLGEECVKNGTMIQMGGLLPSSTGAKVRLSNGKLLVTDGPFIETKELIGGFAMFEFESREEAIAYTLRFMELHNEYWPEWEGETEIRQIFEAPPCDAITV